MEGNIVPKSNEVIRQSIIVDLKEMEKATRLQLMKCKAHEKLARSMGISGQRYVEEALVFKKQLESQLARIKNDIKEAEEANKPKFHESYY